MNVLPSFSRSCTRCSTKLRQKGQKKAASNLSRQTYFSTSIAKFNAQPIDLSSGTTPASNIDETTLAHDILSRAETDPSSPITTTSSTSSARHQSSQRQKNSSKPQTSPSVLIGRVSRTGTMLATVQITRQRQVHDKFLQKHYTRPLRLLAHDPNPSNFLREGDVVEYSKWTEAENVAKQERKQKMLDRQLARAEEMDANNEQWQRVLERQKAAQQQQQAHSSKDGSRVIQIGHGPAVRELLAKRARIAKEAVKYPTKKKRGVRFVVRRVVSPFGIPVEERMDPENIERDIPESASRGGSGTDSLLKSTQGSS